jgi:uncharacterized protein YdaU (DUF1376 family)
MPKPDHPPAFQFYPADFTSDSKVEAMSTEEVGAYILLLCKAWREEPPGSLPNDDRTLARWTRLTPDRWAEIRSAVLAPFTLGTDTRWHQKRMRLEFTELIKRRKLRAKAGKTGADARWQTHSNRMKLPMAKDGSSPPSSSSSSNNTPPPPMNGHPAAPATDDALRRDLEEEVFICGVVDARRCVAAALANGCNSEHIRAAMRAWAKRNGELSAGSLHYRLMELRPGMQPDVGWPQPKPEVVAVKRASKRVERERQIEEEQQRTVRESQAAADARELKYGGMLDAMNAMQIEELCQDSGSMMSMLKKNPSAKLLREWLLVQLEKREALA